MLILNYQHIKQYRSKLWKWKYLNLFG